MEQKQNLIKKKGNSGITLVALVITIVVLLILAGITITMLFSDSGIITKAREAADATKNAQSDTEKGLENLAGYMELELAETAEKGKIVEEKFAKWTDESGTAIIPGGYCVVKESSTGEKNTVGSGLVISDLAEDTLDNNAINGQQGNQFVWVPVPNPSEMYKENNGNYEGKLYDFRWNDYATDGNKLTATEIIRTDTSYREPDVVVGSNSTSYDAVEENLKKVLDNYNEGKTEGSQKSTASDFKKQLQEEFKAMIESVKKYGGFYIGRYESSGLEDGETPIVKPNVLPTVSTDWYTMYKNSKKIAKEGSKVTSSMIWGCQWDQVMLWMKEVDNPTVSGKKYIIDSSEMGWYKSTTGSDDNDNSDHKTGVDLIKNINGKEEVLNRVKNIYDLAGNMLEWTLEASRTNYRATRGSSCNSSGSGSSASDRILGDPTGSNISTRSSRVTLYINL